MDKILFEMQNQNIMRLQKENERLNGQIHGLLCVIEHHGINASEADKYIREYMCEEGE